MKKILMVLLAIAVVALLPRLIKGQAEEPDKKKVAALMQRKLEQSQKVLQGLALGDFDLILKHAEQLHDISKLAEFRVIKTPRYEIFSGEFQRTSEALIKNAKDKNLDAVALSYVELTLTCVKCHKHVREVRMTSLDD